MRIVKNENLVNTFFPKFCKGHIVKIEPNIIEECICKHSNKCEVCRQTKSNGIQGIIDKVLIHEKVCKSGLYNYEGCRIPINNVMDTDYMRQMLGADYYDLMVCDLLKYGFPIGISDDFSEFEELSMWKCKNHKGANDFPDDLNKYLGKEASGSCILGPFKRNPFSDQMKISPLNTVPKKDTAERRVILDLSMPKGRAINDFVDKDYYLNEKVDLVFPKTDDFAQLIKAKGQGCLLFKKDLRKAYRQISICPSNYNLVAFCWKKHIFCDTVLSMGLRSAAAICQRVTNAIAYMMFRIGVYVLNYLDDLAGAEVKDLAEFSYDCLGVVLKRCGLKESVDKASPPSEIMTFLGVLFNTITMTMEVTPERLEEISKLVAEWLRKPEASLRQVQSLVGKLNFVAACVRSGRVFICRLINWMKDLYSYAPHVLVPVPFEVQKDICWWDKFLSQYNGISIMVYEDWSMPDAVFSTDACLSGCGGIFDGNYFHADFPSFVREKDWSIAVLELLGVIVALKLWAHNFKSKRIRIYCDNESVVQILNTGKSKCLLLQEGLREVCFLMALAQCEIRAVHLSSEENRVADCLSRWSQDDKYQSEFFHLNAGRHLQECAVSDQEFVFLNRW